MKINAITTSHTRPNSKPASFGKVESIRYITPDENRGLDVSEGDLKIKGQIGHYTYSIVQCRRNLPAVGYLYVKDKQGTVAGIADCFFPDGDLSNPQINGNGTVREGSLLAEEDAKSEFFEDAAGIMKKTAKFGTFPAEKFPGKDDAIFLENEDERGFETKAPNNFKIESRSITTFYPNNTAG